MEHKWGLRTGNHNNRHLLRAWRKYGDENFEFSILEKCDESKLNEREIYWIEYYDSYYNGYNQTKGGDGCFGKVWSKEEREKISRAVLQISLDGKIVQRFINIDEAGNITGINRRQIWNCANKRGREIDSCENRYGHYSKTAGGYIWVYEDEFKSFDLSWHQSKIPSYAVCQYDVNWNLVYKWPSAESVKQSGYEPTVIRSVCQGKFMTAYGYLWSYDVEDIDEYILWFKNHFDVKYIGQYSLSGKLIKIWNTAKETEIDGFRAGSVRLVLNGQQFKHKGYTFKYIPWKELKNINWKGQLNYGK